MDYDFKQNSGVRRSFSRIDVFFEEMYGCMATCFLS